MKKIPPKNDPQAKGYNKQTKIKKKKKAKRPPIFMWYTTGVLIA